MVLGLLAADVGGAAVHAEELVLYSGRSKSLVEPIVQKFSEDTGVRVVVKYGNTAQLAVALLEEGERTPADVFWSQDAGALGAMVSAGLFAPLDEKLLEQVPAEYRGEGGLWVATSGRARTLAYSTVRVTSDQLPKSDFDLTDTKYKGKVGWAPTNASFQSFVTALRKSHGEDTARAWLRAMKDNGAVAYPKNTAIIEAIAAGEVDFGLPNHYYLMRFIGEDPNYPVAQTAFEPGDIGNLVNVAGVGVLKTSKHGEAANKFAAYLLSESAQRFFADDTFEYPVVDGVPASAGLTPLDTLRGGAPAVELESLEDLQGTLDLLAEVGLR
jgi:iron(III) transport system substrate-binding protein